MIGRLRAFVVRNAIMLAVIAVTLLGFGVQTARIHGFAVGPFTFEGLSARADRYAGEAKASREAFDTSEALRGQEQAQAQASFAGADDRCNERVDTARKAARTIEEVTYVPQPTFGQAPVADRPIIGADSLRDIIGQGAPAQAAGVPTGSDQPAPQ